MFYIPSVLLKSRQAGYKVGLRIQGFLNVLKGVGGYTMEEGELRIQEEATVPQARFSLTCLSCFSNASFDRL
jgi:hypothetical protein